MSSKEQDAPEPAATRWLSIIGINEDGIDGLSPVARGLIESATVVFGGVRHLSLASSLIRGMARSWTAPFDQNVAAVLSCRGRPVCVLASGDPFMHGIGSVLAGYLTCDEVRSIPAASAFSLAASRLLWPLQKAILLSLCGRTLDYVRPHLHPGVRILALTSGSEAPAALAELLCSTGFADSRIVVLESLGGPRERIRAASAGAFQIAEIDSLNVVAIEVVADQGACVLPRAAGLPEALFEHDGQITKREIRAVTLSALAPRYGEHLWDVGAGSGSIAVEWMLADPSLTAVAIERRSERAARIRRNADRFGVPGLRVVESVAPAAFQGLDPPHAAFLGGGAATPGLIDALQDALRPRGRLVVNAVTLETEAALVQRQARFGGSLTRIQVSRASPIGAEENPMLGWRTAMPVVQWLWLNA